MKPASRFVFELWGKLYCPIKHFPLDLQRPVRDSDLLSISDIISYCISMGYTCHLCISLPDEYDRMIRIGLQDMIAKPFRQSSEDWQVSEHSALRLFNNLSAQQQDIFFRMPYMTTAEMAADLGMKYNAVRSAEYIIHKKMHCSTKEELNAMLIITSFYCQPPLLIPPSVQGRILR